MRCFSILKLRDAVAQQAADAVVLLEDRDLVPGAGQLLRGGQARGAGADHGYALAAVNGGRLGLDAAFGESRGRRWSFRSA